MANKRISSLAEIEQLVIYYDLLNASLTLTIYYEDKEDYRRQMDSVLAEIREDSRVYPVLSVESSDSEFSVLMILGYKVIFKMK